MPRYPGGDYYLPPGTIAAPDTTIESTKYNVFTADVETELNAQIDKDAAQDAALAAIGSSTVAFTPTGDIVATNVQDAIVEVDTEMHAADTTLQANITAGDALRVLKAGDTMTGHLTLPITPAAANAVRKDYVDAADTALAGNITSGDALKVAKAGDTMTGVLNTVGVTMGSVVAPGGTTDLSKHLSVYGGSYGLSVTSGTLNAVADGAVGLQVTSGAITTPFATLTNGWDATCVNATLNYGSNSGIRIMGQQDAFMSFHRLSGYAVNFGLGNDNTLRWGGWSAGGNYWRLWSERDGGWPVSNGRLAYAGDLGMPGTTGIYEPYGGGVCTGMYVTGPPSYAPVMSGFRFRYMQLLTSTWFTIGYV